MRKVLLPLLISLLAFGSSAFALDRDWRGSVGAPSKAKGDWHGSIGLGGVIEPQYMGASSYIVWPMPTIDAIYKRTLFISGTRGIGVQYHTPSDIIVGARALYTWGRNNTGPISNMNSTPGSIDGGIFINYLYGPVFITTDFVAPVTQQGNSGAYAALGGAYKFDLPNGWEFIPRAGITYASQQYMNAYFGVSPSEAINTGFTPYTPSAGVRDFSIGLIANYLGVKHWRLYMSGGANFLLHDATQSDVVSTSSQYRAMIGFARLF